MDKLLFERTFAEHHNYPDGIEIPDEVNLISSSIKFRKTFDRNCVEVRNNRTIHTSYFIGADWIDTEKTRVIYVEPKINMAGFQTDYLKMLFSALRHSDLAAHTGELFEIKTEEKPIELARQNDVLTPLLIVQFLAVVKNIVRKGLKKSYYEVSKNLYAKTKGKVDVSKTIKSNILRNKPLLTHCSYSQFGTNCVENRLLKKGLMFVQRYVAAIQNTEITNAVEGTLNYIMPAFEEVSDAVEIRDIANFRPNQFFKEYLQAIGFAQMILKRFGYNILNTQSDIIKSPPFWIDMSKLFELYSLGLLKARFGNDVKYHFTGSGNELDYLINTKEYKVVADAKYKTRYQKETGFKNEDIRQVSGYARLNSVYSALEKSQDEVIDCLIIYPDQNSGVKDFESINLLSTPVKQFSHIFKIGVALPEIPHAV